MWLHVDAALAGTAMICPEYRWMWDGVERADSVVFNPHKWMGTGFDLSAYYVRDPEHLVRVMSTNPSYLRTAHDDVVRNLRDWGIPLGRRFRALKLWFLLREHGVEGLQARIRRDIGNAAWLAEPRGRGAGLGTARAGAAPDRLPAPRAARRSPATRRRSPRTTRRSSSASTPTAASTTAPRCSRACSSSASPSARSPPSAPDVEAFWAALQETAAAEPPTGSVRGRRPRPPGSGRGLRPSSTNCPLTASAVVLTGLMVVVGSGPTRYGRIISLSSCSRMWQCHTKRPAVSNVAFTRVTSPG